jgi:hypothetical protein
MCLFQLSVAELTSFSLLGSESGFEFVTQLVDTPENDHIHIYSLWGCAGVTITTTPHSVV